MFSSTLNTPFTTPSSLFSKPAAVTRRTATVSPRAVAAVERRNGSGSSNSLYEVLRVEPTATRTEIKTAYRSLAKVYHPDLTATADGRDFMKIHNAYETLSDPAARALYDLSLVGNGRRRTAAAASYAYSGGDVFYPTRRWETDQCW